MDSEQLMIDIRFDLNAIRSTIMVSFLMKHKIMNRAELNVLEIDLKAIDDKLCGVMEIKKNGI